MHIATFVNDFCCGAGEGDDSLPKEVAAITNTVQGKDMDALPTQDVQRTASSSKHVNIKQGEH